MRNAVVVLAMAAMLFSVGARVRADDAAPKPPPAAEKISVPVVVRPSETRNYKVSVAIKGKAPVPDSDPVDVDGLNSMKIRQQYGVREGDGLLTLEISVLNAQATVGTEKVNVAADDYPKLTLLLDRSWKITNMFGVSGTRYAGQVPGLNYGNLILLFSIPDGDKPHAIGESWSSKAKLPGIPDEVSITTTLKATGETDGVKSLNVHQDYVWNQQKLAEGKTVDSKAAVDSVFALETGKLLKSHAECHIVFQDPAKTKPEAKQYAATSKIDILLEKEPVAPSTDTPPKNPPSTPDKN